MSSIINLVNIKNDNNCEDTPPIRPRRNPKRKIVFSEDDSEKNSRPRYEARITNLKDLIKVSSSKIDYCNLDMKSLRKIRKSLIDLDNLVGMKRLKESIFAQIIYYLQNLYTKGHDYLHTVLYGAPGCGKTTVAEIIGNIFSKLGILSSKSFQTATRDDLIAGYLGQTALKTSMVLNACNGGVLFLDEIYSLGDKEKKDSFSKECIDTINLFLSENKDDFMLIVAGYEKEIDECFFDMNPGLRRRFMWHHHIDPYSPGDLSDIFINKVQDIEWNLLDSVSKEWLDHFFSVNEKRFKYSGGDIENFLTLCKIHHAKRIFGSSVEKIKFINCEDILEALKFFKKDKEDKNSTPPFGMYS
jgi:SpoVK/Ycf46/Vps4 family AAA+-type ATPase